MVNYVMVVPIASSVVRAMQANVCSLLLCRGCPKRLPHSVYLLGVSNNSVSWTSTPLGKESDHFPGTDFLDTTFQHKPLLLVLSQNPCVRYTALICTCVYLQLASSSSSPSTSAKRHLGAPLQMSPLHKERHQKRHCDRGLD